MSGPLSDVTVVEFAGIGPAPFVAMMLADMGARVIRIDRTQVPTDDYTPNSVIERSRESIAINLKSSAGQEIITELVAHADVVIEGFRPGVMERLELGPDRLLAINPGLVYARITGWGQDGPLAREVGHDITYTAITGALHSFGEPDRPPVAPLNLVGDFGGAAMHGAFGIVSALLASRREGIGQVVDANVVDGTGMLLALIHGLRDAGTWRDERGANLIDGAAPYYRTYRCADDRFIAVGCIEKRFFIELLDVLDLDANLVAAHGNRELWPHTTEILATRIASKSRDEWARLADGRDACLAPVLDFAEAQEHPHAKWRKSYVQVGHDSATTAQPSPAPRFSETSTDPPRQAPRPGQHTRSLLTEFGFTQERIQEWNSTGMIMEATHE